MSVVDEIKARLDLVAYIGESVSLKKAGRNYKALCPFHQERTPSFIVFPESQTWRCFGACGEGGDIFAFAMRMHGWDFNEALQNLAQRAGVELKPRSPQQAEQEAAFERLLGLLEEAARFFHTQLLQAPAAQGARHYVARRGLSAQTVEAFLLGYAPDDWGAALDHLRRLGYSTEDILAAGVATRNDQGRVYDRFRHRLMIPIRDGRGRVIGFGARALRDEDQPKYLNSPQSDLFDKSQTLFGLDMARREIRETETAVIVEGYMDVMQAHQAGFGNVVAQMGTALTEPQLQLLRKYADRLILALDPDQAGVSATMRGLDVARRSLGEPGVALLGRDGSLRAASRLGIDLRVLLLPEGKDPDDLIREQPDVWQRLVREAEPVADYVIRVGTAGLDPRKATVFEKEKAARALLPLLLATESDLHKEANVQKLALALHLPERRLMEIALETRAAVARRQPTNPRLRQRRRTAAMDRAALYGRRPRPAPPPDRRGDLQWVEGPPPPDDAQPPPPDWPDLPADQPQPEEPEPVPVRRLAPVSAEEAYCLGVLLARPERLYQTNRALREVAEEARARFPDQARQALLDKALGPLSVEDFRDTAHQAILRALQQALQQDEVEPLEFVRRAVGEPLQPHLQQLLRQTTFPELIEARLSGAKQPEVRSILKQMRREGRLLPGPESELIDKAFRLRWERLRRANEELYFVQQEADESTRQTYQVASSVNEVAIVFLSKALERRAQALYDT